MSPQTPARLVHWGTQEQHKVCERVCYGIATIMDCRTPWGLQSSADMQAPVVNAHHTPRGVHNKHVKHSRSVSP
jgi:hypothetical protein